MHIKRSRLLDIVRKFRKGRVLVIGDLILDKYIVGRVERISPEAPVPVLWVEKENFLGGGALNVGLNIASLQGKVGMCGIIGKDHYSKIIKEVISKNNIYLPIIEEDKNRPTTLKTRVIAQHQQIVRIDWESVEPLSVEKSKKLINRIYRVIDKFNAVILEDYGKGVINPYLVEEVVDMCKKKKKIVTVDPKEEHFDYYEGVTALTPNLKEAQNAINMKVRKWEDIDVLGEMILKKLNPQCLVVTLGENGMKLFINSEGKESWHIPTTALEVYDVTGAGDTVISVFTLALSCGADFKEAALLSNIAAGIVVGKLGASTVSPEELQTVISNVKTDLIYE